jgi:hypothetical protein
MSLTIALPQARIALGWVVVQGKRLPVEIDMEWMLAFARLVDRTGGTSGDTNFSEYINQFFDAPSVDAGTREALRAVDELRNELTSSRADVQALRGLIEELAARIAEPQQTEQLRNRIESIEDRLA